MAADPGRMVEEELELRRMLGFPPICALAEVGGVGANDLLAPLVGGSAPTGVDVLGPRADGRHLVRAPDAEALADTLASLERPRQRVRVAVDPPRA